MKGDLFVCFVLCVLVSHIWRNTFFMRLLIYRIVESQSSEKLLWFSGPTYSNSEFFWMVRLPCQVTMSLAWTPLMLPVPGQTTHLWPVLESFPGNFHPILEGCSLWTDTKSGWNAKGPSLGAGQLGEHEHTNTIPPVLPTTFLVCLATFVPNLASLNIISSKA